MPSSWPIWFGLVWFVLMRGEVSERLVEDFQTFKGAAYIIAAVLVSYNLQTLSRHPPASNTLKFGNSQNSDTVMGEWVVGFAIILLAQPNLGWGWG